MSDVAKLKEALIWLEEIEDDYSTDEYRKPDDVGKRRALGVVAEFVRDLLESPDIILIRKVDGEWPEKYARIIEASDNTNGHYVFDALSDSLAKEGE